MAKMINFDFLVGVALGIGSVGVICSVVFAVLCLAAVRAE